MTTFLRAALLVALTAGVAAADEPEPPEPFDADGDGDIDDDDRAILDGAEVIRVEGKTEGQRLRESARAVTVIDTKTAGERTADMGEVLSRAQGIQVRRSGGLGSASRLSLNGLYDRSIRTFIDGVPVELAGFEAGIENAPVGLARRVDVHRGVVPIALGADALGGAIDLVTDPSWDEKAVASYQTGSFGTHRATASVRGGHDGTGAVVGATAFLDLAANDYEVDVEVADREGQIREAEVPRFHDGYLAAGGSLELGVVNRGPVERALVRVYRTRYVKELQHNAVMTVPYGEATFGETARGAVLTTDLASGPWRARVVAGGARRWLDFDDRADVVYDWFGQPVRERSMRGEIGLAAHQRVVEDAGFGRFTVERELVPGQAVRVSAAPTVVRRDGTDYLHDPADGRDPMTARADLTQLVSGAEHELRLFDDRLENIGFVKHYLSSMKAEDVEYMAPFIPRSSFIQNVGVGDMIRYQLSENVVAKASYEWSTRLPTAGEVFGDGGLLRANFGLEPERSHNLNLGGRLQADTVQLDLNAFARLTGDMILLLVGERSSVHENVYAARVLGLEGGASWVAPGEWASLEASATFQDIRNASGEGTFAQFEGDRIPNRPWLLGALSGTLRHRGLLGADDEISAFADSRYVHEFYRGWESVGTAASKQVIEAQLVHGAGVTYALRTRTPIVTTFEVANLLDTRVFDSFGVQRPGRAFYLRLSLEM